MTAPEQPADERDDRNEPGGFGGNSNGSGYRTYEAIKEAVGDLPSEIADGKCSSGVYRVGESRDIEAGRYFFEGSMDEAAAVADQDSATYVMNSLDFDGNSITDMKYVLKGGTQTVAVKGGERLDLSAAVATPAE